MDILQRFNADKHLKDALIAYIHDVIDDEALKRMYAGEDVSHIKDARDLIDKAFSDLEEEFIVFKQHEAKNIAR